jgi:hypothetical protein
MMLEIEDALKPMFEPLRDLLRETRAQVERGRALGREAQYESFEGRLVEKLAAVERGAHQATLSALDVDAPQIVINGEAHVRVLRDQTTYMSQAGGVPVMHSLYRRVGERNSPTVDPIALRAGAIATSLCCSRRAPRGRPKPPHVSWGDCRIRVRASSASATPWARRTSRSTSTLSSFSSRRTR